MRAAADDPVGLDEADLLLQPLEEVRALALCVSGGPDSLALLHIAAEWRARRTDGPRLEVLTVDHGLRPSSSAEARMVRAIATGRYGIPARILRWTGERPSTGIEEAARDARYGLLAEAAQQNGLAHLVLAHHRDDQAETFLMRLARGSSVYGLAAMAPMARRDSVTLFRPFLDLPKARLRATVALAGLEPVEDETNLDSRFLRGRLRRLMPELAREGLTPERLAGSARSMARVAAALNHYAERLKAETVSQDPTGTARLVLAPFLAAPQEIRLRLVTCLLQEIGGSVYPPRSERLEALVAVLGEAARLKRTLAGVIVEKSGPTATFRREPGRSAALSGRRNAGRSRTVHLPEGSGG